MQKIASTQPSAIRARMPVGTSTEASFGKVTAAGT